MSLFNELYRLRKKAARQKQAAKKRDEAEKKKLKKQLQAYNPLRKRPLITRIKNKIKERKLHTIVLIRMELANGFHKEFLAKIYNNSFIYNNKTYVIDETMKYWIIEARLYAYDYHEKIALPIKRIIDTKKIRDTVKSIKEYQDIELSINPSTLKQFVDSEIAKQVLKAGQLDDFMRQMRLIGFITMITVILHIMYYLYQTGAFSGLTG